MLVRCLALAGAVLSAASLVAGSALRAWPAAADGVGSSIAIALIALSVAGVAVVLATCLSAWATMRHDGFALLLATLAAILVSGRVLTGAILSVLDLAVLADVLDLGLTLAVLGSLVGVAAASLWPVGRRAPETSRGELVRNVVDVTGLVVLVSALSGAAVRAVGAGWSCGDRFPECNGLGLLPFGRDPLADVQLYHRLFAYVTTLLVAWIAVEALRSLHDRPAVGQTALLLCGATGVQGLLGAASVASSAPALTQALHTLGTTAAWGLAVWLSVAVRRAPARATVTEEVVTAHATGRTTSIVMAYVQLTKPRVMSLLLAPTATAMVIAARGTPDVGTLIATMAGGALVSGGAGAINHYVDRDIDPLMGRTAWRPIPSGVISPSRALAFGILLAAVASVVFLVFVNLVAWILALVGLLGYVFIYTLWLKRSTPSNIVIGGAAGAIPPLVGWAAVTHEISSLTAWYLFAIIFFWTPPHFWALSLLIRQHYERAGVPMLPVVRGEAETRRQIVLYSAVLVALTLVLSPFGMMGLPYFAAALVLGAFFLRGALRLWREATPKAARSLYLYSLLYLFALFTAMAVDRVVTA
ncbi:MAG: hypothetical protein NVSMB2_25260 [Chloroflexota bacterium]